MAAGLSERLVSAALGLILDFAREETESSHLNTAIDACRSAEETAPLFDVDRRSAAFARMAEAEASPPSCRWGLWAPRPVLKTDAIRPATWVMKRNPGLRDLAIFGGNLRASIIASLAADAEAGRSETALADTCGVTRKAIREAVDHLEFCGLVRRAADAGRTQTRLADDAPAPAVAFGS